MRNKKRMLAAGLISVAFLSTVTGCGSASRKVQEPQGIQGTGGTAPNSCLLYTSDAADEL